MKREIREADVLIIGGGTAGCYAAAVLGETTDLRVLVVEKAGIERSGCLAAGVNALNAYITEGHVPQDYVDYARKDADGIVRGDLLLTMSERLNGVTADLERRGLVILKDEQGKYVSRGWRNLKINGENIKPILARAARAPENVEILEHVAVTDLLIAGEGKERRAAGAVGFSVREETAYELHASSVLIATGGAAGLYRPNNPGFSRHKMWYPPFNTGAGYAMGFLAGAEMTTFEMRFIALRCKDTIAPTGTIAQGVHARQVNARGEVYEQRYGLRTSERLYGTVQEKSAGRGPCYLQTRGITREQEQELYRAYLNMAPSQTLRWLETGDVPSEQNVEIEGTEPYIVGGHTASGFWVDSGRRTTLPGLYAAGDVAGGAPQKYVTGALAEGEIAAESIAADTHPLPAKEEREALSRQAEEIIAGYEAQLSGSEAPFTCEQVEEAMQKVMDEYAGGIGTGYAYSEASLAVARRQITSLQKLVPLLRAQDTDDLLRIAELSERLVVCQVLIAHLLARKETRWHSFAENRDHPDRSDAGLSYVNSRLENGQIRILRRELVGEEQRLDFRREGQA